MKPIWTAGIVLLAAILISLVRPPGSTVSRLTNLDLTLSDIPDTYLILSKSNSDKAFVVNRRDSTMRRSNKGQPGRKWDVFRIKHTAGYEHADTWIVKSKREGKGTVIFVPAIDVGDWSYPFFYNFVAARDEQLKLPQVSWTQLYVNRVFHGLYLRVALPFDKRKKDGGSGILREVITVDGSHSYHVNSRLNSVPGLYAEKVTESYFPAVADAPPHLLWLASLNSTDVSTFVMSNLPPFDVSHWPVPLNIAAIYKAQFGANPAGYLDDRFGTWIQQDAAEEFPFDTEARQEMQSAFNEYAASFAQAIRVVAEYNGNEIDYHSELEQRQHAARQLGLELERF